MPLNPEEDRRPLYINPRTGRYTRAKLPRSRKYDKLSWQLERILGILRRHGPLDENQLRRMIGVAPCIGRQLNSLWKRQLIVCDGGRWSIRLIQSPVSAGG